MPACLPCHFSRVWLFVPLWTIAHQAPLSVGFSRQEYWSGGLPWGSSGWESASHCRGRWLYPWSQRVPRAAERLCPCAVATKPVLWGPRATRAEPMCLDSAPQLGRPLQRGACTPQLERIPHTAAKTQNSQKRCVSSQLKKKKITGVGCHALLQRIFLTQGSNPNLISPALAGAFFTAGAPLEALYMP